MKMITKRRWASRFFILLALAFHFSCDDYSELKPLLAEHAAVLKKTIGAVHSTTDSDSLCNTLRTFNHTMESIITRYETLRKKLGGPHRLFTHPPSTLEEDINRIKLLSDTLRDSLLSIHAHTESAAVRRALIQTSDSLDKIRD